MRVRTQFASLMFVILAVAILASASLAIHSIQKNEAAERKEFRTLSMRDVREKLKNFVDIAYTTIEENHGRARDIDFLQQYYGRRLRNTIDIVECVLKSQQGRVQRGEISLGTAKKEAYNILQNISRVQSENIVWMHEISNTSPEFTLHFPFLKMASSPSPSTTLNDMEGNIQAFFNAAAAISKDKSEGFLGYPIDTVTANYMGDDTTQLCYFRLFKPWGWIVGANIHSNDILQDAKTLSVTAIKKMRYDQGRGYFWINTTDLPFPSMVMHATLPELDGSLLDKPEFFCARGQKDNLFTAFVEECQEDNEGYVDYLWPKPTATGLTEPLPKLSYVRKYEAYNWIVGSGVYTDMIDAEIARKSDSMESQINRLIVSILQVVIIVLALTLLAAAHAANYLATPIEKLSATMKEIGEEGISEKRVPPLRGAHEVASLGTIFNKMLDDIRAAVQELNETTAAKKKIEGELSVAQQIQIGLLPKMAPPMPIKTEFEIAASMEAAKEVGGDFYDFFFIDDDHFCFAVGDVADKGVPASLFMAVTKTLIGVSTSAASTTADIMARVNAQLAHDNDNYMFVTVFCGILNIKTGEVLYTNAGHNPPCLVRKNGDVSMLPLQGCPALAIFEDAKFTVDRLVLEPGDTLFTYSDGVTEAMNPQRELYSEERLIQELIDHHSLAAQDMLEAVAQSIEAYVEGAEHSDDITMLLITYRGASSE
jgi:serine phosphatase RsbU (regulator of sigma subunit)